MRGAAVAAVVVVVVVVVVAVVDATVVAPLSLPGDALGTSSSLPPTGVKS